MSTLLADPAVGLEALRDVERGQHEQLLIRRGRRTGIYTAVAVHSTVLGPALGGCRAWHYPSLEAAVRDVLRLSRAMTLKAAAAELALGGGKGVIWLPDGPPLSWAMREQTLRDFADTVNELDGQYITAEDVGTSSLDMAALAASTPHVVGRPADVGGSGDPGEFTATGVLAAMRACCAQALGSRELRGRSVAIVGLGSVGAHLARDLAREGARLVVSDVDAGKRALAQELGATWVSSDEALEAEVDVLAMCALGGMLDPEHVERLRCRIVCGAANNQLASDELAERLAARGILYAPDFIVNAGGLINVSMELTGYDRRVALRRARGIEAVMERVLTHSDSAGLTPLAAATELAVHRLAAASAAGQPAPRAA